MVQQALEQAQFRLVLVAFGIVEQHPGSQAEHPHQFQQREAAAGLLAAPLGIGILVLFGVGQAEGGAVNDFGAQAVPELSRFFARTGHGHAQAAKDIQRQSLSGLAVSAVAGINVTLVVEDEEGLNLADNFAAGAVGVEHLIEESEAGAAHAVDALAAVGTCISLS